jgi:glycosyltransferase involved in cell wall biosynthesis
VKYVIIPCLNEAASIENVIKTAEESSADRIVIVENGSDDGSSDIIRNNLSDKTFILSTNMPLGHDIPKALGLHYGLLDGGEYFIFFDGDMTGITKDDIDIMFSVMESGIDLALTDCYCDGSLPSGLASYVLEFRKMLNKELNIFSKIKHASPSHGPVGISKNLAASIPLEYIGVPPLLLG